MFSRGYLQSSVVAFILLAAVCSNVICDEDVEVVTTASQYGSDEIGKYSEGFTTDPDESNNGTEITATPVLSTSAPSSSTGESTSSEKSTVTITPSTPSLPTMIITATKVTLLDHRMLPLTGPETSLTEAGDTVGVTEVTIGESTTDSPAVSETTPERVTTTAETPKPVQSNRQARYHRLSETAPQEIEETATEPTITAYDAQETATDYYRELEADGGDSYGDFLEENEIPEKLPIPMPLINTNGEGNNPPLEDDFAEAFKKVNSNGRRRRFRGGRRGRIKQKRFNNTVTQSGPDSSATGPSGSQDLSQAGSRPVSASEDSFYGSSFQTTTVAPLSTGRPRGRYRSTASPNSAPSRPFSSGTTSTETTSNDKIGSGPIVKNGPKPMILQNLSSANTDMNSITPSPQIERPGGGAHTEKISTYFFSTPAPANRMRLRPKITRDSVPSTSTTTTTELPAVNSASYPAASETWKHNFEDYSQNTFYKNKNTPANLHIPAFVPMDLGLEKDKQDPVESSLSRPDPSPLENKAYSIHHSPASSSHATYESYSNSLTSPKSIRIKRPQASSYTKLGYDPHAQKLPTMEMEKAIGTEYFAQGAHSEPSTTFATAHRPTPGGSHYDRTKDKVIFYQDSPYSSQRSPSPLVDIPAIDPSPGTSHTVGTHLSVADPTHSYDSPITSTVDHQYSQNDYNQLSMYTPGQVYPDVSPLTDNPFKNGPLDGSHIHSPNMVEGSASSDPSVHPESNHGGGYSHTYIEATHQPASRPTDTVYGTVEEVPIHGSPGNLYDHGRQHQHHHSSPSAVPYPFHTEPPKSPLELAVQAAQALVLHREISDDHHHQTAPAGPPPSSHNSQSHHGEHLKFTPSYQIKPSELPNLGASNPTEMSHQSASSMDAPSPTEPLNLHEDPPPPEPSDVPSGPTASSQSNFNGHQVDQSFPPHSHTMSVQPDYEPANPPLPHDHPFHTGFIPFPTQEINPAVGESSADHYHNTNSISNSPYQPAPAEVEHDSRGKPDYESVIHGKPPKHPALEFQPIPDDVKDNNLYHSYGSKPFDTPSPPPSPPPHLHAESPDNSHNSPLTPTGSDHYHQAHHPSEPQLTGYSGPILDSHYGPPDGKDTTFPTGGGEQEKDSGYSGPVSEIHSGTYPQSLNNNGDSYSNHGSKQPYPEHNSLEHDHLPGGGLIKPPGEVDYKPTEFHATDAESHGHDLQDQKTANALLPGKHGKKDGKRVFSKTPYVLMFPQLIPEEAMRPSPPSLLSKEIPVIQASSMADFTSGEKPPLGPGFQAVPVHPRHQMYQVLAKTHYDKMMEKYMESKKRPPSAIYTPYGVLIPVGTNVGEAASSSNHNVFSKPRLPPKFRGEKSLLNALLGSASSTANRYFPQMGMDGKSTRLNKLMEYEPALDLLAEKLALKLATAQQGINLNSKLGSQGSYSDHKSMMIDKSMKVDEKPGDSRKYPINKATPGSSWFNRDQDQVTMESKYQAMVNPELKEYLKGVLKGHLTEMVGSSNVPIDDGRRPATLSSKLMNSFFRKSRLNLPPKSMIPLPSASMLVPSKVPPPPPPSLQSGIHQLGIGPHLPPMGHGPVGLLGTIKRLFSFGPPDRHEIGIGPNFAGRTLYIQNGTYLPYLDGPSPRSSHYPHAIPQIQPSHPTLMPMMMKSYPMPPLQSVTPLLQKLTTLPTAFDNLATKAPKKKRKSKRPAAEDSKWQHNRLTSSPSTLTTQAVSTTAKPHSLNKSTQHNSTMYVRTSGNKKTNEISQVKGDTNDASSKKSDSTLNKRRGESGTSGAQQDQQPNKSKPSKLDMFQTLLGSTRSVLNYFKEGRKTSPTVLKPRSSTTSFVEDKFLRKRSVVMQ